MQLNLACSTILSKTSSIFRGDNGTNYGDYLEQFPYLCFLKMNLKFNLENKSNISEQLFFVQLGRVEELGSGIINVNKYLIIYTPGAKPEFIENHLFETVVPLSIKSDLSLSGEAGIGNTLADVIDEALDEGINEGINNK